MRNIVAIIPAAGVGTRMQTTLPKQYLTIGHSTVLEHTLRCFLDHPLITKIIVALSPTDRLHHNISLLNHTKVETVWGGETRAESVYNALQNLDEQSWALVHDAARPCLKRSDLDKLLQIDDHNGAILAVPAVDTIKRALNEHIIHTEDRSTLWHALTPQFFPAHTLKTALARAFEQHLTITDESSAMELAGFSPLLIEGRRDNIKITHPEDLALASFYLNQTEGNEK